MQKQMKKTRQLFRREIKATVAKLASDSFETGDLFNYKPKYMPVWLWEKLKTLVVNNNFRNNYEIIQRRIKEGRASEVLVSSIKSAGGASE